MKKCFLLAAVFLCCTLIFAGGGGQQADSSGPARLTVTIWEDIRVEDFETNLQTLAIEREANVDLTFNVLPATDYTQRINLMVMAGGQELTDIIMVVPGDAMVYQWAQEGAIVPVTRYYRDPALSPNIHEAFRRVGRNFTQIGRAHV